MQTDPDNFDCPYRETRIRVMRHDISGQVIYRVIFADNRKPLVLHRALNAGGRYFWTSIPEGRKAESEEIGKLIEGHQRQIHH